MGREQALEIIAQAGGTITRRAAESAGISKSALYRLRDEGRLWELSRGVFRVADAPATAAIDLVAVCKRVPNGAICLNSALAYWDLTDESPAEVHVAVPRGTWRPRVNYPPTRVHAFASETFDLGRLTVNVGADDEISIYSPERTIADAFRMRHRIGRDLAFEALRRYLDQPRAQRRELLRLARALRAEKPLEDALEILG